MCDLCRRAFLGGMVAIGASSVIPPSLAQTSDTFDSRPVLLPARGEFVISNAHVITMDPQLGDIPGGFVHVRNGVIVSGVLSHDYPFQRLHDPAGHVWQHALGSG